MGVIHLHIHSSSQNKRNNILSILEHAEREELKHTADVQTVSDILSTGDSRNLHRNLTFQVINMLQRLFQNDHVVAY